MREVTKMKNQLRFGDVLFLIVMTVIVLSFVFDNAMITGMSVEDVSGMITAAGLDNLPTGSKVKTGDTELASYSSVEVVPQSTTTPTTPQSTTTSASSGVTVSVDARGSTTTSSAASNQRVEPLRDLPEKTSVLVTVPANILPVEDIVVDFDGRDMASEAAQGEGTRTIRIYEDQVWSVDSTTATNGARIDAFSVRQYSDSAGSIYAASYVDRSTGHIVYVNLEQDYFESDERGMFTDIGIGVNGEFHLNPDGRTFRQREEDKGLVTYTPKLGGEFSTQWVEWSLLNKNWNFDTDGDGTADLVLDSCYNSGGGLVCMSRERGNDKIYRVGAKGVPLEQTYLTGKEYVKARWDVFTGRTGEVISNLQAFFSGYSGASLFYDEPDPAELPRWMSDMLGGIDGWTSAICAGKVSDSDDNGIAFSPFASGGASAHIEGARIPVTDYTQSPSEEYYMYKISFEVDVGSEERGCDINFRALIKNSQQGITKPIIKNSRTSGAYTFKLNRDGSGYGRSVSYTGSSMELGESTNYYDSVCIRFDRIDPEVVTQRGGSQQRCLIGVNQGEEICVNIIDEGPREMHTENPCRDVMGFSIGCLGGGTGGESWRQGEEGQTEEERAAREATEGEPVSGGY